MSWRNTRGVVWGGLGETAYKQLADYNAEKSRGLVHTAEWEARMADYQQRFDAHQRAMLEADPNIRVIDSNEGTE